VSDVVAAGTANVADVRGALGDTVVEARSLAHLFAGGAGVHDLSFSVRRGELFGIVGPDGAGKTTTMRMLAGVLPPTSGDAEILGISVARDPERVKPHTAYMAQRFGLYVELTVRENLLFYADLFRVPKQQRAERMARLYRFSGLGEFEDRLAGQLSGGMKQKLSLSCALIHQPDVLLLDEPTFGVDPISRRDLWLILHQMIEGGMTAIVTTSYMDEAERCDRVAMLHEGRLIQLAAPADIQRRLDQRLLAVTAAAPREMRDVLRALPAVRRATLFGNAVHVVVDAGVTAEALHAALQAGGHAVERVEAVRATLEDAFIDLVST
jgi:ABC-2 type transport system ATP-binding protein